MQQPAPSSPSPTFAGMLAALTAPLAAPGQRRPPARDLDGLEDDVATLSYERALRAHARYKAPDIDDRALTSLPDLAGVRIFEAAPAAVSEPALAAFASETTEAPAAATIGAPEIGAPEIEAATIGAATIGAARIEVKSEESPARRNLKTASITIRMSVAECAQLHNRAAEAGLTVSAYLRSCTLEAESLRAMVKDTLAQLRAKTLNDHEDDHEVGSRSWFGWLRHLWTRERVPPDAAHSRGNPAVSGLSF